MEPRLWRCLLAISSLWPPDGIIMDVGCNDGRTSVLLATHFGARHAVLALEPIHINVRLAEQRILRAFGGGRNGSQGGPRVDILQGGLGARSGNASYPRSLDRMRIRDIGGGTGIQTGILPGYEYQQNETARASYEVFTVDELLERRNQRLSFAHWDVEGGEAAVLDGARRTIARDLPIFTLEAFPHSRPREFVNVMQKARSLGYRMMEIPESCGRPADCRNFVCVPEGLWERLNNVSQCRGSEATGTEH